jgi:hypothetical protein
MKKALIILAVLVTIAGNAFAGCYVDDPTFYSKDKTWMTAFVTYMDPDSPNRSKEKALRMIDDGRIKTCTRADALVIERDNGLVYLYIHGIGKVWIYENFVKCQ